MNRIDIHIIVNILIGILIGGVLVWGLSQRELDQLTQRVDALELRVRLHLVQPTEGDAPW